MASDMVKDHSDSEIGNPLPPHGLLFSINSKVFFYMHHPTDRIPHTTAFVTPVVEHWLEQEIAHERTLLPRSYISLPYLLSNDDTLRFPEFIYFLAKSVRTRKYS